MPDARLPASSAHAIRRLLALRLPKFLPPEQFAATTAARLLPGFHRKQRPSVFLLRFGFGFRSCVRTSVQGWRRWSIFLRQPRSCRQRLLLRDRTKNDVV